MSYACLFIFNTECKCLEPEWATLKYSEYSLSLLFSPERKPYDALLLSSSIVITLQDNSDFQFGVLFFYYFHHFHFCNENLHHSKSKPTPCSYIFNVHIVKAEQCRRECTTVQNFGTLDGRGVFNSIGFSHMIHFQGRSSRYSHSITVHTLNTVCVTYIGCFRYDTKNERHNRTVGRRHTRESFLNVESNQDGFFRTVRPSSGSGEGSFRYVFFY